MKLTNSVTNIIAAVILGICFLLSILSIQNMSLTMDEKAHIPSGYSYLAFQDYRLNPEHPPLAKDLSAIPLLFLDLKFPTEHSSWTEDLNGQWESGEQFIFKSGNDADQIIFWSRIPMILLLLLTGWFIFFWVRKLGGNKPALLALTLFSFSPSFLAHGRLVTTDIAAVFGFLIATYFWTKFLRNPSAKNVLIAGIMFGIAMCLKFSLVLLVPSLGLATVVYAWLQSKRIKTVFKYIGLTIVAGLVGLFLVIWPLYQLHIVNYPAEQQISDMETILEDTAINNFFINAVDNPVMRPITQYAFGLLMATSRVARGNTVYFLGKVTISSWKEYFPVMYVLKAPLSFHFLTLLVMGLWLAAVKKAGLFKKIGKRFKQWILDHLAEFSLLIFFIIYWATSILGNLNLGVRHILPVFPIMYILISVGLSRSMNKMKKQPKLIISCLLGALMLWYIIASVIAFPHYISYYNELVGGSGNGYKYAVDSNYDWGQDLKRLAQFVEENNIEKINVSYFGGDNTSYRLGDNLAQAWVDEDEAKNKGWIAISATLLQERRAIPAPGYDRDATSLAWLNNYEPIRIGNSIFVYYID
ncbi:MAG: glycosyltransferase family 39 protein [Patescibacteria group bacterium]|nr:glycosyltransferase family 39 protein [Patescibacteria group bacterium]